MVRLSNHFEHEVHIDKYYYRANDAVLEISKISKIVDGSGQWNHGET